MQKQLCLAPTAPEDSRVAGSARNGRPAKAIRGFTLIELLVVIAIIAILVESTGT